MRKQIIKDKFLTLLIVSLFGCSGFISINNNWLWYFIAFFSFFSLLSLFAYFRKEYYVKDYSIDKDPANNCLDVAVITDPGGLYPLHTTPFADVPNPC